jgi:hypothetical protein
MGLPKRSLTPRKECFSASSTLLGVKKRFGGEIGGNAR